MPVIQTLAGCLRWRMRSGLAISTKMPGRLPIRKQIADSWKGGILPEAAVSSASSAHIRIAVKPIRVARVFNACLPDLPTGAACHRLSRRTAWPRR